MSILVAVARALGTTQETTDRLAGTREEPGKQELAASEPIEQREPASPQADAAVADAGSTASTHRGKTLIVDDEEDMRLLLRLTIDYENRGLLVVGEASSGDEALTIHRELDIDVIVLDQRMPGLTGVETAMALLEAEPDLPIVLYSAFLGGGVADEARRIGVSRCVEKGDVPALIAALRELTGSHIDDATQ